MHQCARVEDVTLLHEIAQGLTLPASMRSKPALLETDGALTSYDALADEVDRVAGGLAALGLTPGERVVINLPKSSRMVAALFAVTRAGAVAVPTNPNMKGAQLAEIIRDCGPQVVISTQARLEHAGIRQTRFPFVRHLVTCEGSSPAALSWERLPVGPPPAVQPRSQDLAAILYTSGSSGRAKGVMLTHENLVLGAKSVVEYLGNKSSDRLLAVLPLSFDAGLSQVTTALLSGGTAVLYEHLFAGDVPRLLDRFQITGLTGVPSFWAAIGRLDWKRGSGASLRYFANTGGALRPALLDRLLTIFPDARPYLMYGLTEAFRSTYLPPEQARVRPTSIGKAVPHAEVFVLRPDGTECEPHEHGEIVHAGPLVARGYWKRDGDAYARFGSAPACASMRARAVWTGDVGYRDAEGYLYFVSRRDDVVKVSGYRVSLSRVEAAAASAPDVEEACALPVQGAGAEADRIVLFASPPPQHTGDLGDVDGLRVRVMDHMRALLPRYALPAYVVWLPELPKDLNGKLDRHQLLKYWQLNPVLEGE